MHLCLTLTLVFLRLLSVVVCKNPPLRFGVLYDLMREILSDFV